MDPRRAFLEAAAVLRPLITAAADRWEDASALEGMTIGDLAAHATRAVSSVVRYLDAGTAPNEPATDAAGYFLAVTGLEDHDSDVNRRVRQLSADESATGPQSVLEHFDRNLADLSVRLPAEPADRTVRVFMDVDLTLDEYLETRMVELVVHTDDLTASLGLPDAEFPDEVAGTVIDVLTTMARRRHGDLAVVRALARRERDRIGALRVL